MLIGGKLLRNLVIFLVISIFVLGGLGAAATPEEKTNFSMEKTIIISEPEIRESNNFLRIELNEANSITTETGKPILPVVTEVFTFPFKTKIEDVKVSFSNQKEIIVDKAIEPSPEKLIRSEISKSINNDINYDYCEIEQYPNDQFTYRTGSGIKNG